MDTTELESELRRLEDQIAASEDEGIRARWKFGRRLVQVREGKKQLPKGSGTLSDHAAACTSAE
jgi:hypothetical protein